MQPVAFQDVRPSQSIYDEAQNSQNLQNMWQIAIASNSEWVQLVTWNDYSEGTSFAPSAGHGRALLDMSSYGLYSFRSGASAAIVRDTAYLIYRNQSVSAVPVNRSAAPMTLRQWSSPARDTVEVLSFLTAPAVVKVTVGTDNHLQCPGRDEQLHRPVESRFHQGLCRSRHYRGVSGEFARGGDGHAVQPESRVPGRFQSEITVTKIG
ncbi:endo-1,3-alpha-glucanase family glycosylhydrolase [Rhodococcus sp. 3Y1]